MSIALKYPAVTSTTNWHQLSLHHLAVIVCLLAISACSSGGAQLDAALAATELRLATLESALDGKLLRNANIISQYVVVLKSTRPELTRLLDVLSTEATTRNPFYKSLRSRYSAVKDGSKTFASWTEKIAELELIQAAANTSAFNDALSDTVNVLADLSDDKLARVNATTKETELAMNNAKDFGAGSQHVGNPHYGYWSHGSGGSFWAWYGQYALFSSLLGYNRPYYNNWASRRGYSYYHDIGRNSYSSPSQKAAQFNTERRARKQFGSGGKFKSPYSKSRSGATDLSRASAAQQKSAFSSRYSKAGGANRKYQSSTRNSNYRTSRGLSRGK